MVSDHEVAGSKPAGSNCESDRRGRSSAVERVHVSSTLVATLGFADFISHNITRKEIVDNRPAWVHRKGATRAFPAGHHALKGTIYEQTGHPILLPGNPQAGSCVMVADDGAAVSCYSVNHGAGRVLGRKQACRVLDQQSIDHSFDQHDILTNCRMYPKDEAPAAHKDFDEVLQSVKSAGLASEVARLKARFVIKDGDKADD